VASSPAADRRRLGVALEVVREDADGTGRAPELVDRRARLGGRADDPHPEWLAEARRLRALVHAPGFRPGAELARTAEWARFVGLIGLIGSTPARALPGAVARLELVAHERGRSSGGFVGEAADAFAGALATLRRLPSTGTGRGPADGGPGAA
jgi:hypothetical protein